MNKKLLLVLCIFLQTVQTFAQKVDLDGKRLKYTYFQLPTNPISEDSRTFSVGVVVGPSIPANLTPQYVKQASEIGGFTRLNKGGRIMVDFDFAKFVVTSRKIETKDGTPVNNVPTKNYAARIEYKTEFGIVVTDTEGMKTLLKKESGQFLNSTYRTNTYAKYDDANAELRAFTNEVIANDVMDGFIKGYLGDVTKMIGYEPKEETLKFYYMDSKKHPENKQFNEEFAKLTAIMAKCTAEQAGLDALREEAKPVLAYFEAVPARFTEDDKQHRKMRYGGWYNAATLHYALDNFDEAGKCAQKVIDNKYDESDGKDIIKKCNEAKILLEANKIKSRHLLISWKKANEIPESQAVEVAKAVAEVSAEAKNVNFDMSNGVAFTLKSDKDETIQATMDMNRVLLICMKYSMKDVNINGKPTNVKPGDYKSIAFSENAPEPFSGITFESIKFTKLSGDKIIALPQRYFAEKFVSGKIEIYKFYDVQEPMSLKGMSIKEILNNYKTDEGRVQLDRMIKKAHSSPYYLVKKGDNNAKYLNSVNMENLFEDNPTFLAKYKAGNVSQNKKKGLLEKVLLGDDKADPKSIEELAKKVEAILEYNEAK